MPSASSRILRGAPRGGGTTTAIASHPARRQKTGTRAVGIARRLFYGSAERA